MKVLLTGANGFVGRHVARYFIEGGLEVQLVAGPDYQGEDFVSLDLSDRVRVMQMMDECRPDVVLHLAAKSSVKDSWDNPHDSIMVNVLGTLNLWQAASQQDVRHFVYVSTAEVYQVDLQTTAFISETSPLGPTNPYGISKVTAEQLLQTLQGQSPMTRLTILRPFNHTGPGQRQAFVLPSFARQLAAIKRGAEPIIRVGNLSAVRDFLDVRDVAAAYHKVVTSNDIHGVYNVCSGTARSIRSCLEDLIRIGNLAHRVDVVTDANRERPQDATRLVGDSSKFCGATNWKPTVSWTDTLGAVWADALTAGH